MMNFLEKRRFARMLIGCASLVGSSTGYAAILSTGANVMTSVQELIEGTPGSISSEQRQLGVDTPAFPLDVSANLVSTDLDGTLVALAQGFGRVADPTVSTQANPQEFAIELGCYANIAELSYSVQSRAIESRTVIFTSPGSTVAPNEVRFRSDGTREIESRAFISGAIILWSKDSISAENPIEGQLRFSIHRDTEDDVLFDTALSLVTDNGTVGIESTGPLRFEEVGLAELRDLGVDESSLDVLANVQQQGFMRILVLPPQEHAYTYTVTADESFELIATLEAKLRNAPNGSGIAAVVGRPFSQLTDFIETALPGVDGQAVERSINRAADARANKPVESTVTTAIPRTACGALGMGGVFGLFIIPTLLFLSPSRRLTRRR